MKITTEHFTNLEPQNPSNDASELDKVSYPLISRKNCEIHGQASAELVYSDRQTDSVEKVQLRIHARKKKNLQSQHKQNGIKF